MVFFIPKNLQSLNKFLIKYDLSIMMFLWRIVLSLIRNCNLQNGQKGNINRSTYIVNVAKNLLEKYDICSF